jgi:hypothetical protein
MTHSERRALKRELKKQRKKRGGLSDVELGKILKVWVKSIYHGDDSSSLP